MIITGLLCRISDGTRVRTYLLTTAPYHDPALASQIEFGTALSVIPPEAGLSIRERIRFQPQGGGATVSVSEIPLINSGGRFDDWGGWVLSGLEQVLARGYVNQPFSEWPLRFELAGRGKPEFIGRERVMVTVRDQFAYMSEPVANQVFTAEDVSNDRLINVTVPMVFGTAYQVDPLLTEPQIQRYAVGSNVNDVPAVQAGGNPSTPLFAYVPLGFQLFAPPSLKITCDVSGPPIEGWEQGDVLADIGSFDSWTDDEPDGWEVTEDLPYSDITETVDGHAGVQNTAKIDGTTAWITGTDWTAAENVNTNLAYQPSAGTLADALAADDGTFASVEHKYSEGYSLTGKGWSFGLTNDVQPVQIDGRITLETDGGANDVILQKFYLRLPNGSTRNLLDPGLNYISTTKGTLEFTITPQWMYGITREILEDPDLELYAETYQGGAGGGYYQTVKIHEIALKIHYGTIVDRLRLTTETDRLTIGNRYLLRIHTEGAEGDSIKAFFGGVAQHSDPIPASDNPHTQNSAQMEESGVHEFFIVPSAKRFAIAFDRGVGNGEQVIKKIEALDKSASRERYVELMKYIHETAGKDPAEVCDVASYELVQTQAGNPRLGHYVTDQTTRAQVSMFFSHSLAATDWGGLDGKHHATQQRVPKQPAGEYLAIEGAFDPGHARPDPGEDLRDRTYAAANQEPLRQSETAGVTSTWPEEQRQQVLPKWRIVEKADWSNLVGYPKLTFTGIDPATGSVDGGTNVTGTGSGFSAFNAAAGDMITVGGNALQNITIVSDTKFNGDTPASTGGATGAVDFVVTIGGESITLENVFTYQEIQVEGLDAVVFRGDYLDTPSFAGSQPLSYFVVARTNRKTGSSSQREYVFDGAGANGTRNLLALRGANTNKPSIWAGSWLAHTNNTDTDWHVIACLFDGAGSRIEIDGDRVTGNAGANNLTEGIRFGGNFQADQDWLDGDEFEVIVPASVPDEATWEKIVGYLAYRAGIEDQLASGHAYESSPPDFDPSDISTHVWLKDTNSDGAVSSWQDQSGESNHAAQATSSLQPEAALVQGLETFGSVSTGREWVYGALAANGNIYCCPGEASHVLRIDPSAKTLTTVGSDLGASAQLKWVGFVEAGNGKLYAPPGNPSDDVLIFDPSDETTSTFTGPDRGYYGGALADNEKIYFTPQFARNVLVVDPSDDTATTIGSNLGASSTTDGRWSWFIKGDNGKLYAAPRDEDTVLVVDPSDDSISTIAVASPTGTRKWAGGVKASTGEIWFVPRNAETILVVDPSTDSVRTVGSFPADSTKWNGAVSVDGKVYFTPRNRRSYLVIDPTDDSIQEVFLSSPSFGPAGSTPDLFVGAVASGDEIFLVPFVSGYAAVIEKHP